MVVKKIWLLGWVLIFLGVAEASGSLWWVPRASAAPTPGQGIEEGRGVLSGLVVDADGPVAGATVRVQNGSGQTVSAEDGSFTLTGLTSSQPFTVTAAARGYYIRWSMVSPGQQEVTITLERHTVGDNNEGYEWQSAEECGECHTAFHEWQDDAHAQAALNPRFLTMYKGTDMEGNQSPLSGFGSSAPKPVDLSQAYYGPGFRLDYPDRTGNCATCHTPMASNVDTGNSCGWSGCHTEYTEEISEDIPPGVNPFDAAGVAAEGISCDFCHKIGKVALDEETGLPAHDKPGILSIQLYRPNEGEELFFGSVNDVTRPADSYLALQADSAFCAPCHYGAITRTVIYNSYGEWLASPYSDPETGKTCQECHMPPVEVGGVFPEMAPEPLTNHFVFPDKGGLKRLPSQTHTHKMWGAGDETFLQNAVSMTTTAYLKEGGLFVEVSLTNERAGHHVPTDSPLRQLLLVVQATDAEGNKLPLQEGLTLPEWAGDYANQPGKGYAKILKDPLTGEVPSMNFWRPSEIITDTRLAALATDTNRYTFSAPATGPVTVEAHLFYRRAFQQLMEWKGWDDPDILMEATTITVAGLK
jgi:hypothetical protein